MPNSDATKKGLAAVYVIFYAGTVLWAFGTSGGASGGMAFVLAVILGIPWSLLLGLLLLVANLPRVLVLVMLLIVPPVINLYLLLRSQGIFRATKDTNQVLAQAASEAVKEIN